MAFCIMTCMSGKTEENKPDMLNRIEVRPIMAGERAQWEELIREHHYLGLRSMVGKTLRYVAAEEGRWLALIGWQAAALKCRGRDQWIGWTREVQYQRLHLVANNTRFLILPGVVRPNLASKVLSLNLKRLSRDWEAVYGHPVLLAETFVDRSRFTGACYRAANWQGVGETAGYGRSGQRYWSHGQKKEVFVYPLHRRARQWLRDPLARRNHARWECKMSNAFSIKRMERLHEKVRGLPECRSPQGRRHSPASVLTIAISAILCGARGYAAIAEWAGRLNQNRLRRVRVRWNLKARQHEPPSEPTIRRVLQAADANKVDKALANWLLEEGIDVTVNEGLAVDGKTLRGAKREDGTQVHLLSAFLHQQGITVAQVEVGKKTNEIPEIKRLLEDVDIRGRVVTADALHTQTETARFLVEEKGADYVFTVKDNQPTLLSDIAGLREEDFSPCAGDGGKRPWEAGSAENPGVRRDQ